MKSNPTPGIIVAMEMEFAALNGILLLLAIAVVVSTLFHRFRLPSVLGYIVVGILVGPHALKLMPYTKTVADVAEFGVVFLLFTIGLEFSLSKLIKMKTIVFGYGLLQVLISVLITVIISMQFPMTFAEALIVGCIVALSSTALVTKQLRDQFEIATPHGTNSVGILLFQDLAVVPMMILIPSLVEVNLHSLTVNLSFSIVKGAVAIVLILFVGRLVLRPLFYRIAKTHSVELFMLTTLLVTLGSAWLTMRWGLSLALGAFIAGIMLGETEFRHQIEGDIKPFRDVLLGLFFISVGMQFNPHTFVTAWVWICLLLAALVFFKIILIFLLGLIFKQDRNTSLRTSVILAQGGEFGFALLTLATSYELIRNDYAQVVLGALLLSMSMATLVIYFNRHISELIFPTKIGEKVKGLENKLEHEAQEMKDHVLICGFGGVSEKIVYFLNQLNIPYFALDNDPIRVENALLAGHRVDYGDASEYKMLDVMGVAHAKALLISFSDDSASKKILQQVRLHDKNVPIIVRSHYDTEAEAFYKLGATLVVPEVLEASLMLVSNLLLELKVPVEQVDKMIENYRLQQG